MDPHTTRTVQLVEPEVVRCMGQWKVPKTFDVKHKKNPRHYTKGSLISIIYVIRPRFLASSSAHFVPLNTLPNVPSGKVSLE